MSRAVTRVTRVLSSSAVTNILRVAEEAARDIGVDQCIAVVDPAGDLLGFQRMDAGKAMSIQTSMAKARAAARTRSKTGPLEGNLGLAVAAASQGSFTELRGGVPLIVEDDVVGAIGVGSGTPAQDEAVAAAVVEWLDQQQDVT